jgi:flagellar hook-associated protein 1
MSLLSSLLSTSSALSVFDRAVEVSQNNTANVSTPDYASQSANLTALQFDPLHGMLGGLRDGPPQSSRNEFAEAAVRNQQGALGLATQQASSLQAVEGALNLSGSNGIPAALGNLFQSFSAWSLEPSSSTTRQAVLDAAQQVAASFQATAGNLAQVRQDTESEITGTVDKINALAGQLRDYNQQIREGDRNDPALDAKMHQALETLSGLVNLGVRFESDGTATVLAGGQTPLVIGDQQYQIAAQLAVPPGLPPGNAPVPASSAILDSAGRDITAQISGGQLGALVGVHNGVLASLLGDASQPGELNRLAQAFADRVNQVLSAGTVSDGPPPVAGAALFSYDTSNATRAASTLALDPAITPDQLAAIDPGPPYVSNGTALKLAALANPQDPADEIDNVSYVNFFGNQAAAVGRALVAANDQQDVAKQLVAQAQNIRQQISGVSLDEQAVLLVQFQRTYEANSKMISILDELAQTAVNLLP